MNKLIVVTGGAGFIGRNTVAALNARGVDHLLLVDVLGGDDKWKNLRGLRFDDLISPADFLAAIEADKLAGVDAIIHLGACSSTTEGNGDYLLENNYRYTRRLCQWSLQKSVRFVYASSAATYGDGSAGYSDDDGITPTLRPLNMYGFSKHLFDLWALQEQLFDRIVGLKYFNVYGPYEDHKGDMRSVVNKSYGQILQSGRVQLFKSYRPDYAHGQQKRDFIWVKDAVDVTLYFLDHRQLGGLFNCGSGQARCWNDLATAEFAAMGLEPQIEYIDMPESLRSRYQYFTQADISKLRKAGYAAAFTTLEDGVRDYVTNYLAVRVD